MRLYHSENKRCKFICFTTFKIQLRQTVSLIPFQNSTSSLHLPLFPCRNALDNDINTFWMPETSDQETVATDSAHRLHSIRLTFSSGTAVAIDKIGLLQRSGAGAAKKVRQAVLLVKHNECLKVV